MQIEVVYDGAGDFSQSEVKRDLLDVSGWDLDIDVRDIGMLIVVHKVDGQELAKIYAPGKWYSVEQLTQ